MGLFEPGGSGTGGTMGRDGLYLLAALPWLVIAPLKLMEVLTKTAGPSARIWVSTDAQHWATVFWSSQLVFSVGYACMYLKRVKPSFVLIAILHKLFFGCLLIKGYVEQKVLAPMAAAGVADVLISCVLFANTVTDLGLVGSSSVSTARSNIKWYDRLALFAGRWWYPWVVAALSGINTFTIFLSGPLAVLFLSGVLANPRRRFVAAVLNAVGTTMGMGVLLYLVELHGKAWLTSALDERFNLHEWERTRYLMQTYGVLGAIVVASMPVVLHTVVALGVLAGMSPLTMLGAIFVGRTVKYSIMAELAVSAPRFLALFAGSATAASMKSD